MTTRHHRPLHAASGTRAWRLPRCALLALSLAACLPSVPRSAADLGLAAEDVRCTQGDAAACTTVRKAHDRERYRYPGGTAPPAFVEAVHQSALRGCRAGSSEECLVALNERPPTITRDAALRQIGSIARTRCDSKPTSAFCDLAAHDPSASPGEVVRLQELTCLHSEEGELALSTCDAAIDGLGRLHETERQLAVLDHACSAGLWGACGRAALAWLPHDEATHDYSRSEGSLALACRHDPRACERVRYDYLQQRCAHEDRASCHALAESLRFRDPIEGAAEFRRNCQAGYQPSCQAIGEVVAPPAGAGAGVGVGRVVERVPR